MGISWVDRVSGDLQGGANSVDGVSDMAPACWLCGGSVQKGTMASACLDANVSISPIKPLVSFKLLSWCWSSEEVSLSR